MSEPSVYDDPEFQKMQWDTFDPTGYERNVDSYKFCGCKEDEYCLDCVPF